MKVKEIMRELMEKDPDDEVKIKLKVRMETNSKELTPVSGEASVDDVLPGNTPVLLTADLHIDIESKVLVW